VQISSIWQSLEPELDFSTVTRNNTECEFRFDFIGGAEDPLLSFTEITRPSQLMEVNGFARN
jgi:hypothetical protein